LFVALVMSKMVVSKQIKFNTKHLASAVLTAVLVVFLIDARRNEPLKRNIK